MIFLIPLVLFSQEVQNEDIETNENKTASVEEHLKEQQAIANETIKNINEEKYFNEKFNKKNYDKDINHLINKINVNKRVRNDIAVKRDEIKLLLLKEERFYLNTLKEIIDAKRSLKDKEYFINVLKNNIVFT